MLRVIAVFSRCVDSHVSGFLVLEVLGPELRVYLVEIGLLSSLGLRCLWMFCGLPLSGCYEFVI